MLPDSISEEKLKINLEMEELQAGPFWCRLHQNNAACRSSIIRSIFVFSSEMESGNISPPLIKCQLKNSKILKNLITLVQTH